MKECFQPGKLVTLSFSYTLKMAADSKNVKSSKAKSGNEIEVYTKFQLLRSEQRKLAMKLSELEVELNEHKIVIDTIKDLDGGRKCFRMIGGILCEKTVKDVLPVLRNNQQQLGNLIESLNEQLSKKGLEINEFKEKHNITIRGQDDPPSTANSESDDKKSDARNIMVNPI